MKSLFLKFGVFSFLAAFTINVSAGLLINPKRVVLEERERAAALDLLNDGAQKARYQIFFEQKLMREDGSIVDLEMLDPDAQYAKDMIRYSPRRVDIEPGQRQTIRIAARRPKGLPDGEYLSHLVFQEIPITAGAEEANDDEEPTVSVKPRLKIAIPIIIRKGELSSVAGLESIIFDATEGKNGAFEMQITREGSSSLYGSVEVFENDNGKAGDRVAMSKGVGVYTSINKRLVKVRLAQPLEPDQTSFIIRFDEDEKYGGTNLIEERFELSQ
ncbi:hypothetical protein A3762_14500 [Oleiphilus sp. HI0125]|nr:hypothetical protein A3762_14500 [Oleiphilus sp. HI0125]